MFVKAFRLFISSTFADFAQEREQLQTRVFPKLDQYCAARGYQFLPLDLRWGINAEAQLNQRTSQICLDEVRAAKGYPPPNFLILIGNRYGWVPLPYAIARSEFETLLAWLQREQRSQDALMLSALYELDENVVVLGDHAGTSGAYTLRSRENEIPELRPAAAWFDYESRVRAVLQEAVDATIQLGHIRPEAREKYFVSLTEQEILLGVPGLTTAASDEGPAHSSDEKAATEAFVFIRELASGPAGERSPSNLYFDQHETVESLKSKLKRVLHKDHVLVGQAAIDQDGRFDDIYLERFAAELERTLIGAIDRHIALVTAAEAEPGAALQSERAAHDVFAEDRCRNFVGREDILERIATFTAESGEHPLIIFGRSGLGKSALMAKAAATACSSVSCPVISRYIGASPASSDVRSLMISLVDDLIAHNIAKVPTPEEVEKLLPGVSATNFTTDQMAQVLVEHDFAIAPTVYAAETVAFLGQIETLWSSIKKPVAIFLDALDQLDKPYEFGWLPSVLPDNVRFVTSVLNDPQYEADSGAYRTLHDRFPQSSFLEIEPLSAGSGSRMLMALERESGRRLRESQRRYLLDRYETAGGSPLYLKVGFITAQGWKSAAIAGGGRHILAGDTTALFSQFIHELTSVHNHERTLVTRALGYIAASRDGLSVKELTDILALDTAVMQAISSEQFAVRTNILPPAVWVRLYRQLAPFLIQRRVDDQSVLQFFHRQLIDVVRAQHYEPGSAELHRTLAAYFDSCDLTRDGTPRYNKRTLSELPYQLHMSGASSRLGQILMSPAWLRQKLEACGADRLVEDYRFTSNDPQRIVGRALQLAADILRRDERQLVPQLIGRLPSTGIDGLQDFLREAEAEMVLPAILPMRSTLQTPGAEIFRFESLDWWGTTLVSLPDNHLAVGATELIRIVHAETGTQLAALGPRKGAVGTLALLNPHALASAVENQADNNSICIWDLNSLEMRWRLEGHTAPIRALARLDDRRLASASDDGTIRVWDVDSGSCVASIDTGVSGIICLAPLTNGCLASGSRDGTIRIWDVTAKTETHCLVGHADDVTTVVALPGDRLASGSRDSGVIRIWDLNGGMDDVHLSTGTDAVTVLVVLPDGRLVSGSQDGTVCFWNIEDEIETGRLRPDTRGVGQIVALSDGRIAFRYRGGRSVHIVDCSAAMDSSADLAHDGGITALCALSDDRVASGSADRTIKIWNAQSGTATTRLTGHRSEVRALAELSNNRLASGSQDASICLWGLSGAPNNRILASHDDGINALAVLPGGRLASGGGDRTVRLWDIESGDELMRLEGHKEQVVALALHPNGNLISGARETTSRFWDLTKGTEVRNLKLFIVRGMAALPDGRLVVGNTPAISVYDAEDGRQLVRFTRHANPNGSGAQLVNQFTHVRSIAPLANGWLATAASDNCVRVWNPDNGEEFACLEIDNRITSLVALPGGRLVAGDVRGQLHWLKLALEPAEAVVPTWSPHGTDVPVMNEVTLDSDSKTLESYLALQDLRNDGDHREEEARRFKQDNRLEEAGECLEQALAKREQALKDFPDWMLCKTELAETHRLKGQLYERDNRPNDACYAYKQAERLYAGLSVSNPENREILTRWDTVLLALGSALHGLGEYGEAIICFEKDLRIAKRHLSSDPDNPEKQERAAFGYYNVGYLNKLAGKRRRAHDNLVNADSMLTELIARRPDNHEWLEQRNTLRKSLEEMRSIHNIEGTTNIEGSEVDPDKETLSRFGESLNLKKRIAAIESDNADRQFDLATSHETYGDMLIERDIKLEAMSSYLAALLIRRSLAKTTPGNDGGRTGLIALHDKIGDIFVQLGRPEEALLNFRATAAMERTMADANPDSDVWLGNLSISHNKIGGILLEQQLFAEAVQELSSAVAIKEVLAARAPDDTTRQISFLTSLEKTGNAFLTAGDRAQARESFQRGIATASRLMHADPENIIWLNRLATFWFSVGEMDASDDDFEDARKSFEFAVILRTGVAETEPHDTDWQEQLEAAHERAGTMQMLTNDLARGLKSFQAANSIMKGLVEREPTSVAWRYRLAKSYRKLTIGHMETKSRAQALAAAASGQAILQDLAERIPEHILVWKNELERFEPLVDALRK